MKLLKVMKLKLIIKLPSIRHDSVYSHNILYMENYYGKLYY